MGNKTKIKTTPTSIYQQPLENNIKMITALTTNDQNILEITLKIYIQDKATQRYKQHLQLLTPTANVNNTNIRNINMDTTPASTSGITSGKSA